MTIEKQLSNTLAAVPKSVACGVVDMSSGLVLGIQTTGNQPEEVFDLLGAATKDMFEGDNVIAIQDIFKKARGVKDPDLRYFQEIVVFSNNLIHYFARTEDNPAVVFCVLSAVSVNIGLFLLKARQEAKNITV